MIKLAMVSALTPVSFASATTDFIPVIFDDFIFMIPSPVEPKSVEVVDITSNSALVRWITKSNTTTQITLSTNSSLNPGAYQPPGGDYSSDNKSHEVLLGDLSPDTKYYFEINGQDSNGGLVVTTRASFSTLTSTTTRGNQSSNNDLSNPPFPVTANLGNSKVPYWAKYLNSRMNSIHTIEYCRTYNSQGGCLTKAATETHARKSIGAWKPFFGPNSGNRPGYYKGSTIGSVSNPATYYTNWFLNTGELAINTRWYDPSRCGSSQSPTQGYCDLKIDLVIWPGEVKQFGGQVWAVVPMSDDILNTNWLAIVPRDMVIGQNGVEWRNFPVSIDQGLIAGGRHPPARGSAITPRSAILHKGGDDYEIYISGVNTSGDTSRDLSDYQMGINSLNNGLNSPSLIAGTSDTVTEVIGNILTTRFDNPNAKFEIYGHSLGSVDAIIIYNSGFLGPTDKVFGIGVPGDVDASAMKQSNSPAQAHFYCGTNDWICQSDFDPGSQFANTTEYRKHLGAEIQEINTGSSGSWPYIDAHGRDRYFNILGWQPW